MLGILGREMEAEGRACVIPGVCTGKRQDALHGRGTGTLAILRASRDLTVEERVSSLRGFLWKTLQTASLAPRFLDGTVKIFVFGVAGDGHIRYTESPVTKTHRSKERPR